MVIKEVRAEIQLFITSKVEPTIVVRFNSVQEQQPNDQLLHNEVFTNEATVVEQ